MGTGVEGRVTMRDVLDEVFPALSAAGLTASDLRRFGAEVQRRMGPGGHVKEYLQCMAAVIGEMSDRQAERAYLLALDVLFGPKH